MPETAAGLRMQPTPLDFIWSSQWRRAQDSNLRVREQATEWGVCPSNLVREIVSSGRTLPPARMDGTGLFRGKASAERSRSGLILTLA